MELQSDVADVTAIPPSGAIGVDGEAKGRADSYSLETEDTGRKAEIGNDNRPRSEVGYEIRPIQLHLIIADQSVQARVTTAEALVKEYAEAMQDGAAFPPLVVFPEGDRFILADGFHRHAGAKLAGRTEFQCDIRPGGVRDARLFAAGANAMHGLRRTNADKKRAVNNLLRDKEWHDWSDREIARRCHVSHQLVTTLRARLPGPTTSQRKCSTKHGTVTTMDVSKIGKQRTKAAPTTNKDPQQALDAATDHSRPCADVSSSPTAPGADKLEGKSAEAGQAGNDASSDDACRVLCDFTNFISDRGACIGKSFVITIEPEDMSRFENLLDRARSVVQLKRGATETGVVSGADQPRIGGIEGREETTA
jgi:hypothetical protein